MRPRPFFWLLIALLLLIESKLANASYLLKNITSIVELNSFFESFFALTNSTTIEQWEASLPKPLELMEMQKLLTDLYRMENFQKVDSLLLNNYKTLKDYVNVSVVQEHFCVIHELIPTERHHFTRMWGYTVIASKQWSKRQIHHSATHFDSDGPVCSQAAAIFESTRSRALVIAGASRYAVKGDHPSSCQRQFQVADAAHDNLTMFHWVVAVLRDLAMEDIEAKYNGPFFVQWHGMAETSCLASDVFISTGIGNSSIYDKNIPATKLMLSFNRLSSHLGMRATTPRQDPQCRLIAGTNIFGRYINKVPLAYVCNTTAQNKDITGQFVHVEQKAASRENIPLWTSVFEDAFPVALAAQAFPATVSAILVLYILFS